MNLDFFLWGYVGSALCSCVYTGWLANLDKLKHWIAAVAETNATGAEMNIS
jgi:hypothetical protein